MISYVNYAWNNIVSHVTNANFHQWKQASMNNDIK
jgi:hypothetical protein